MGAKPRHSGHSQVGPSEKARVYVLFPTRAQLPQELGGKQPQRQRRGSLCAGPAPA